jgi:acetate kinase
MRVLVVNSGSSSLKLTLLAPNDEVLATGSSLTEAQTWPHPDAIGHRIVHGGTEFSAPVLIDDDVERRLRALSDLAPLHQPRALTALDDVRRVLPDVPAVACFDTAFHASLPPEASTYAVPREWGLRRYGFHGLSHSYASRRASELTGGRRIVTCHLGAGASLAAVLDGRCVDTTMGFTPLEGLVMASRSGSVDPGALLWLQTHRGYDAAELTEALDRRSGLVALAGTPDMGDVLRRHDDAARLAVGVYCHRLAGLVATMAASLGGLDTVVFTGGVGEHAAEIRAEVATRLAFLGMALDADANSTAAPDADVSAPGAAVRTLVIAAREDLEIAHGVRRVLRAA